MVNTVILSLVTLTIFCNVVDVAATKNQISGMTNGTDMISEEDFGSDDLEFDYGSSIEERKGCPFSKKCDYADGFCYKPRSNVYCNGTVKARHCKGKKCKCCIPERCPARKSCTAVGGSCIKSGAYCNGLVLIRVCNGRKCRCCLPEGCPARKSCIAAGGSCIKSGAYCDGPVNIRICEGKMCRCCLPDDCPDGFVKNKGTCYWFSKPRGLSVTWDQAKQHCKNLGGDVDLAELDNPNSIGSDIWLMKQFGGGTDAAWLGGYKQGRNYWIWLHSQRELPLEYSYWYPGDPNGDGACLEAYGWYGYYINDLPCHTKRYFVCQQF